MKTALSKAETATLAFHHGSIHIDETVARADFETWIADDLARIDEAVEASITASGVAPGEIDKVFLTGGTSFVPAVRRLFVNRFGEARIETGEQLLSIAYGLALIGAEEDLERWTVREAVRAA